MNSTALKKGYFILYVITIINLALKILISFSDLFSSLADNWGNFLLVYFNISTLIISVIIFSIYRKYLPKSVTAVLSLMFVPELLSRFIYEDNLFMFILFVFLYYIYPFIAIIFMGKEIENLSKSLDE